MRCPLMSKANLCLGSFAPVSKIDATDWTRELWAEAFAMARRRIKDPRNGTAAPPWPGRPGRARKGSGASGWRVAQAAGHAVFDRRPVACAASGSVAGLERQGL